MYKTCMPHINVVKKFRLDVIQLCEHFIGTMFFSWESGIFKSVWVVYREEGGGPGAWILRLDPCGNGAVILSCKS